MESWERQLVGLVKLEGNITLSEAARSVNRSTEDIERWIKKQPHLLLENGEIINDNRNASHSTSDTKLVPNEEEHDEDELPDFFFEDGHPAERWF